MQYGAKTRLLSGLGITTYYEHITGVEALKVAVPSDLRKYVDTLDAFNEVRKACFSVELLPNYQEAILEFKAKYLQLDLSVTPKIHCVFEHLIEFCHKKNEGFGLYSEQASEAVHHDFSTVWNCYSRSESHSQFQEQLFKAVLKYNSIHV
jgi:hypothetical protein